MNSRAVLLALGLASGWVAHAAAQDSPPPAPEVAPDGDAPPPAHEGEAAAAPAADAAPPASDAPPADTPPADGRAPRAEAAAPAPTAPPSASPAPAPASSSSNPFGPTRAQTPEEDPQLPADDLPPALRAGALDDELLPRAPIAPERSPWRVVASIHGGTSVRLVQNLELQQQRFAPAFVTLRGGVALPQSGRFGHELAVALTSNLSGDGTYTSGLDPLQQWVLTPSYALRVAFPATAVPDWVVRARLGVPLAPAPDFTWGLEVGGSATYMLLAGLGLTVELGSSTFFGARNRVGNLTAHPLIFATVGVTVDWEVL